jgi:hypothetical protein
MLIVDRSYTPLLISDILCDVYRRTSVSFATFGIVRKHQSFYLYM